MVAHGYSGEYDAPIHIVLSADIGAIGLLYEDAARRHDPLSPLAWLAARLAGAVESRPIGKRGIHLIRELTDGAPLSSRGRGYPPGYSCTAGAKCGARPGELPASL